MFSVYTLIGKNISSSVFSATETGNVIPYIPQENQFITAQETAQKIQQEQNSLMHVNDSFKKIIIVKDHTKPRRDEHGFITMGILNFLSDEHSLAF